MVVGNFSTSIVVPEKKRIKEEESDAMEVAFLYTNEMPAIRYPKPYIAINPIKNTITETRNSFRKITTKSILKKIMQIRKMNIPLNKSNKI